MSAVSDTQTFLAAQDIVDGSSEWPSTRGLVHDGSDRLVAIRADGGGLPEIGAATGLGSEAFRDPRVLVTVRGAKGERDLAEDKAHEVFDALHGKLAATLGATTYDRITAETDPIEVGHDDKERPTFTVAFRLARAQGAPA